MTLQEQLAELIRLQEAASEGPWKVQHRCGLTIDDDESCGLGLDVLGPPEGMNRGMFAKAADAKLVAAARNFPFAELANIIELLPDLMSGNHDEREAAKLAVCEILNPPPGKLLRLADTVQPQEGTE